MFDKNDIIGQKFGRLTIQSYSHVRQTPCGVYKHYYNCICDCGNKCIADRAHLKTGHTQSCGCKQKESVAKKNIETASLNGDAVRYKRLHGIWYGMIDRCDKSKTLGYHRYGGRGIEVCEEWHNWFKFKEWALNNGYKDNLTIDRIDSNGNYEPSNCRWADRIAQANNMRSNRRIECYGGVQTLAEWCRELGINYDRTRDRLNRGMTPEEAFELPHKPTKQDRIDFCIQRGINI